MRLIDADAFIEELNEGIYVYCQENTADIIDAIQCQPTIEVVITYQEKPQ